MKQRLSKAGVALALAFLAGAAPAAAQSCSDVQFRIWRPDQAASWYGFGDTLEVTAGEEAHLYVHVRARGDNSYSTSAEIGYPSSFGQGGKAKDVRRHLRMTAQDGDDRRSGRLRFVAEEPGTTRLGYRLEGVKPPGDLRRVPRQCLVGTVSVTVLPRRGEGRPGEGRPGGGRPGGGRPGGGYGDGPDDGPRGAAAEMVGVLYEAILRRERLPSDPDSFVQDVSWRRREGIAEVAATMVVSEEFRRQALRRTEEERGRRGRGASLERLREQLLENIYRDLYGYTSPQRDARRGDLADLDDCLSDSRSSREACARLGRNLVNSDLFYEHHRRLLEAMAPRRGPRR